MRRLIAIAAVLAIAGVSFLLWPRQGAIVIPDNLASSDEGMEARGAYLAAAAGCLSCHWDKKNGGAAYAGGRAIASPFGTFYSPNITPDRQTGIGDWSDQEFVEAILHGVGREGENLYPALPFASYAGMTVEDALAIKAFLMTLPPVRRENRTHNIDLLLMWRPLISGWRLLFFEGPIAEQDKRNLSRGAYLVEVLGHCGECHTPRNFLGGPEGARAFGGARLGDAAAPNITPHDDGIGAWSRDELISFLKDGTTPDFDVAGGEMAEVIEHGTSQLTDEDRAAMADYLRALAPQAGKP